MQFSHKFPEYCFAQGRKHHYLGQLAISIFIYLWIWCGQCHLTSTFMSRVGIIDAALTRLNNSCYLLMHILIMQITLNICSLCGMRGMCNWSTSNDHTSYTAAIMLIGINLWYIETSYIKNSMIKYIATSLIRLDWVECMMMKIRNLVMIIAKTCNYPLSQEICVRMWLTASGWSYSWFWLRMQLNFSGQ